jgi:hypothetical protein
LLFFNSFEVSNIKLKKSKQWPLARHLPDLGIDSLLMQFWRGESHFFQKCPLSNVGVSGKSSQKCPLANVGVSGKSSQKCPLANVGESGKSQHFPSLDSPNLPNSPKWAKIHFTQISIFVMLAKLDSRVSQSQRR